MSSFKPTKRVKIKPRNIYALHAGQRSGAGQHTDYHHEKAKYGARGEQEVLAIQDGLGDLDSFIDRYSDDD